MKVKQVYISDENFSNLIGINASALVNELLSNYFAKEKDKIKDPKVLEKEIKILEVEVEAEKKIKEIIENVPI